MPLPALDPQQDRAVTTKGHCLVSACPGSGKTRVLAARAAYLLQTEKAGRLAAVTFTKDAAAELKARIDAYAGTSARGRVRTGTFHSLALNQLRTSGRKIHVISAGEQNRYLRDAFMRTEDTGDLTFEDVLKGIESIKASTAVPSGDDPLVAVYRTYTKILEVHRVHDFADIMLESVNEMETGRLAPLPIKWLLVDEAQDMDEVQFAWIMAHAKAGVEVTVVGDDDQSIYGWRQAMGYEGMMRFRRESNANLCLLETNYRSLPTILAPAADLITNNPDRTLKILKPFRAVNGLKSTVKAWRFLERDVEVYNVAKVVLDSGLPGEWGILARTNAILDLTEIAFAALGVPYTRVASKNFWSIFQASLFLQLLKSVAVGDPRMTSQALQYGGIHVDVLEMANNKNRDGMPYLPEAVLFSLKALGKDGGLGKETVTEFGRLWGEWREAVQNGRERLVILGVAHWCASQDEKNEFAQNIFAACRNALLKMPGSLAQRIGMLMSPPSNKAEDENKGRAKLMTVHAAKGLEFPSVWIVGAEEGVFPHEDSDEEEERRLMYVAITRAQNDLHISYAAEQGAVSRFVTEASIAF